ncbi:MAG: calcium/proton exchanger [Chloroflexi bacterium]|nr:calcium/proton exchanger [Chloroflexota bacterium]
MARWMYAPIAVGIVAVVGRFLGWPDTLIFVMAAVALIPMAGLIGRATEELAHHVGPKWGGLLNATFGNAAELIILISALRAGLFTLAKASITGSIIGNLLLVLGAAILVGGLRNGVQRFDSREAGRNSVMMLLATVSLVLPASVQAIVEGTTPNPALLVEEVSLAVAIVLFLLYLAYIIYGLMAKETATADSEVGAALATHHAPAAAGWTLPVAVGVLLAATAGTVIFAETLVGTVEAFTHQFGWSEFFVGVIIVPLVGNVAEHVSAIQFARENKMDIAQAIAAGSSTQVALLVAPLAVFISLLFHPIDRSMNLSFHPVEIVVVAAASLIFNFISYDGESSWLEGLQLLGLYIIAGAVFFLLPVASTVAGH